MFDSSLELLRNTMLLLFQELGMLLTAHIQVLSASQTTHMGLMKVSLTAMLDECHQVS